MAELNSPLATAIDSLKPILEQNQTFLVAGHVNPDGDAIGSMVAMGHFLRNLGKTVTLYDRDPVPHNFLFLPGAESITNQVNSRPDVTILVDCGLPGRIGEQFPKEGWGDTIVVVDHHKTVDPNFANLYILDATSSSAGEVVLQIIKRHGALTKPIAQAIYCCILTDTNCFRYSATTKRTFAHAGEMIELGIDPWYMSSHIYESQPADRVRLLAKVLDSLRISESGKLASLFIRRELINQHAATDDLIDGFINYARGIDGVEVATQMMEEADGRWRISFRSKGLVDVAELAERFGGGGHRNRAGCHLTGTCEDVQKQLSDALTEILASMETE